MSGLNYAALEQYQFAAISNKNDPCVFISYKSEDFEFANAINDYLNNVANINTYFDNNDDLLKKATKNSNDELIVKSIKKGLECSSHLLCLISEKTNLSWWVPFEIGIADAKEKGIASLKIKNIEDVPSFLKVKKVLYNKDDFLHFISGIDKYGTLFANKKYELLSSKDTTIIDEYLG